MNELAVKAKNGTNTSTDQEYINKEVQNLISEIDRVQSTTTFNEKNLLTGSFNANLQVGAESGQTINLSISNMNASAIGVSAVSVSSTAAAGSAIDKIKSALASISTQRAQLGAVQNRLEHTIKNLDNVVENTTAAESQIRDTDMASEMVKFSNNNILAQAGQSMLAQANQSNQGVLSILGGGTAGTYYPLGGALADILNKNVKGANASAQSTGASVANVNLLKEGKVDIAFIQNDIAYYASTGTEMFKDKKVESLKGLATLYPETVQIVTTKKTGIKTVADLKGKRVAVGAAGSGTEANARQILNIAGITYKDIKPQYLSFGEAASALKDGNVDAGFVVAGFPTAAIQDLATQHDVVMVSVGADIADKLIAKYPYYTKVTIPAKTYNKVETDTAAVAVKCMLAVTDKMDADTGYAIVKALYGNLDRMKAAHNVSKNITKATGKDGMSIKLNAGAEKFFNEK
jgi:TRAP transporter TAXI family solute receptor